MSSTGTQEINISIVPMNLWKLEILCCVYDSADTFII